MVQQKSQIQKHTNPLDFFIERGGYVIETENGWCNYYLTGDGAYLENLYIYPEKRQKQNGTSILMRLEFKLKEIHQSKYLVTTINRQLGNPDRTLQIALKRGFCFHSANNETIILRKEL